jgi:hypothetical protein
VREGNLKEGDLVITGLAAGSSSASGSKSPVPARVPAAKK